MSKFEELRELSYIRKSWPDDELFNALNDRLNAARLQTQAHIDMTPIGGETGDASRARLKQQLETLEKLHSRLIHRKQVHDQAFARLLKAGDEYHALAEQPLLTSEERRSYSPGVLKAAVDGGDAGLAELEAVRIRERESKAQAILQSLNDDIRGHTEKLGESNYPIVPIKPPTPSTRRTGSDFAARNASLPNDVQSRDTDITTPTDAVVGAATGGTGSVAPGHSGAQSTHAPGVGSNPGGSTNPAIPGGPGHGQPGLPTPGGTDADGRVPTLPSPGAPGAPGYPGGGYPAPGTPGYPGGATPAPGTPGYPGGGYPVPGMPGYSGMPAPASGAGTPGTSGASGSRPGASMARGGASGIGGSLAGRGGAIPGMPGSGYPAGYAGGSTSGVVGASGIGAGGARIGGPGATSGLSGSGGGAGGQGGSAAGGMMAPGAAGGGSDAGGKERKRGNKTYRAPQLQPSPNANVDRCEELFGFKRPETPEEKERRRQVERNPYLADEPRQMSERYYRVTGPGSVAKPEPDVEPTDEPEKKKWWKW